MSGYTDEFIDALPNFAECTEKEFMTIFVEE